MKRKIDLFEYAGHIMKSLSQGILITTKVDEKVNTMAIAWGMLGIEWNKPIFNTFVRERRFTKSMLDENPEFTINVPIGDFDKKIIGFCGTKSGRDVDKIKHLGLTLEEPEIISVPGIKQFPLTLECRVIYKQEQDKNVIQPKDIINYYPQYVDDVKSGNNKDFHTSYFGEIVSAYIIE